jgi:hypothetical protein
LERHGHEKKAVSNLQATAWLATRRASLFIWRSGLKKQGEPFTL